MKIMAEYNNSKHTLDLKTANATTVWAKVKQEQQNDNVVGIVLSVNLHKTHDRVKGGKLRPEILRRE